MTSNNPSYGSASKIVALGPFMGQEGVREKPLPVRRMLYFAGI